MGYINKKSRLGFFFLSLLFLLVQPTGAFAKSIMVQNAVRTTVYFEQVASGETGEGFVVFHSANQPQPTPTPVTPSEPTAPHEIFEHGKVIRFSLQGAGFDYEAGIKSPKDVVRAGGIIGFNLVAIGAGLNTGVYLKITPVPHGFGRHVYIHGKSFLAFNANAVHSSAGMAKLWSAGLGAQLNRAPNGSIGFLEVGTHGIYGKLKHDILLLPGGEKNNVSFGLTMGVRY